MEITKGTAGVSSWARDRNYIVSKLSFCFTYLQDVSNLLFFLGVKESIDPIFHGHLPGTFGPNGWHVVVQIFMPCCVRTGEARFNRGIFYVRVCFSIKKNGASNFSAFWDGFW